LKRLNKDHALQVLFWSIALSVIVAYLLMTVLFDVDIPWIVLQAPMAAILVFSQQKALKEWKGEREDVKYASKLSAFLFWVLWMILYLLLSFIMAFILLSIWIIT
jgi:dolichol kinase